MGTFRRMWLYRQLPLAWNAATDTHTLTHILPGWSDWYAVAWLEWHLPLCACLFTSCSLPLTCAMRCGTGADRQPFFPISLFGVHTNELLCRVLAFECFWAWTNLHLVQPTELLGIHCCSLSSGHPFLLITDLRSHCQLFQKRSTEMLPDPHLLQLISKICNAGLWVCYHWWLSGCSSWWPDHLCSNPILVGPP